MRKFHSTYFISDFANHKSPPYKGRGWFITFEDIYQSISKVRSEFEGIENKAKDVIIHAVSKERAQYVSDMINGALLLIQGDTLISRGEVWEISVSPDKIPVGCFCSTTTEIPEACILAALISYRKIYQHTLFKLLLSFELIRMPNYLRHPFHWRAEKFVYTNPDYYTRCAFSIIAAYSAIEELQLEIRATTENPSFIDGEWNPVVKSDLERRLTAAGIDINKPYAWELRDTPTKIERKKRPNLSKKAEWSHGKIRDGYIKITDAIAYASWLRSKISSHKFDSLVESLNYYDAANVQDLARILLLSKLRFHR